MSCVPGPGARDTEALGLSLPLGAQLSWGPRPQQTTPLGQQDLPCLEELWAAVLGHPDESGRGVTSLRPPIELNVPSPGR